MKKIGIAIVLLMSMLAQAQVAVNIGTRPSWGPEINDTYRYYYLPELDIYYDVKASQFIYEKNRKWVRKSKLPNKYKNYDLKRGYKVVLNDYYRGEAPYSYHERHLATYPKGYKGKPQPNHGYKDYDKKIEKHKHAGKKENRPQRNDSPSNAGRDQRDNRDQRSNRGHDSQQGQNSRNDNRR